jgi:hypothetical protein
MSDFGATITITKRNGASFSLVEVEGISQACKKIQAQSTLQNSFSDPYLFKLGQPVSITDNSCYSLDLLLSDHWGDAEQYKWHKKVEIKDARIIAKELLAEIGKEYNCKANYEWW